METIKGSYCKNRKGLNKVEPLFDGWINSLEEYNRVTEGDHLYWYNEMANVSALSGAAWKNGFSALCEFQHGKGSKHSQNEHPGRCDLYIVTNELEFYIEAKCDWVSLNPRSSWANRLDEKMSLAVKDGYQTSQGGTYPTLAVTFFVLYLPKNKKSQLENRLDDFVLHLRTEPWHAAAWYFPNDQRDALEGNSRIFAGVVMAIENIAYTDFSKNPRKKQGGKK